MDRDEPALLGLSGLIRSVRSPEFAGVVFHEVRARTVLNRVPGGSPMPFSWTVNPYRGCTHACVYCLDGQTPILLADGSTKPLARLEVGDDIVGTQAVGGERRYVRTKVLAHWRTTKRAYRITLDDGTEMVASGDHRFLAADGWRHVTGTMRPHLTVGTELVGTGKFALPPEETENYQRGYLCGMVQGGGTHGFRVALAGAEGIDRTERYLSELGTSAVPDETAARARPRLAQGPAGRHLRRPRQRSRRRAADLHPGRPAAGRDLPGVEGTRLRPPRHRGPPGRRADRGPGRAAAVPADRGPGDGRPAGSRRRTRARCEPDRDEDRTPGHPAPLRHHHRHRRLRRRRRGEPQLFVFTLDTHTWRGTVSVGWESR
ncbi:hypothetical protein [Kutzneria kofuensis]|uniref:hypothetical protein n=1 Tax=Kutzneria kofuensis TaxID=103725 RepID=UPI0031EEBAB6